VAAEAPPPVRGAPHEAWFECPSQPCLSGRYALTPRARQRGVSVSHPTSQPSTRPDCAAPTCDTPHCSLTKHHDGCHSFELSLPGKRGRHLTAKSREHLVDSQAEKLLRLQRQLPPGRLPKDEAAPAPAPASASASASAAGEATAAAEAAEEEAGEAGDGRSGKRKAEGEDKDDADAPEVAAEVG
jgi:hypothetical protein